MMWVIFKGNQAVQGLGGVKDNKHSSKEVNKQFYSWRRPEL